jgi:PAS domain S-box-containing protein
MLNRPFHISMLLGEIEKRKKSNPRYSLRAFARFLGVGPSTLSRILSNHQELSLTACKNIIKKMKFNHDDCMLFISSLAEEKKRRAYKVLYGIIEDSTEEELNSYEWLLANTPDLMFVFDRYGRCIHANEPVAQFFEISPLMIIGKTMEEIGVAPEICKKIRDGMDVVFKDPHRLSVEECYELDGDTRCFEINLVPIGHHKEVRGVACHWRDITEKNVLDKLWQHSLQVGETLAGQAGTLNGLEQIAAQLTEKYCDACVIEFPEFKIFIEKGEKNQVSEFKTFYPLDIKHNPTFKDALTENSIRTICHLDEASLNIFKQKKTQIGCITTIPIGFRKKIVGTINLMRFSTRKSFTMKDAELARDIKLRIECAMENSLSHLQTTL